MSNERKLFKSEEQKSRSEISAFLQQLASRIDQGQVTLGRGQEEISLQLPESAVLEVQVEDEDKGSRGIQHSLEIEIKWFDGDDAQGEGGLELR